MGFNMPGSAIVRLDTKADVYAEENVKVPYYDIVSRSYIICYTENGQWTYISVKNTTQSSELYRQLLEKKRQEFMQIHSR